MIYTAEFDAQWKTFLDVVETRTRSLLPGRDVLRSADYAPLVRAEAQRWQEPTQYQGAWLAKVARTHPETAEAMRAEIGRIQVTEREFPAGISRAWPLGAVGAVAVATVGLLRQLNFGILRQITGGVGVLVILGPIIDSRWEASRKGYADVAIAAIRSELQTYGTRLRQLLQRADGARQTESV